MTSIQASTAACRAAYPTVDRSALQGPLSRAVDSLADALGNAASTTASFSREALDRLAQAGDAAVNGAVDAAVSAYAEVAETAASAADLGSQVLDGAQSVLEGGVSGAMLGASALGSALDLVL